MTPAQQKVYDAFIADPYGNERSNLFNSYKRGVCGLSAPSKSRRLAFAAWCAGRDHLKAGLALRPDPEIARRNKH